MPLLFVVGTITVCINDDIIEVLEMLAFSATFDDIASSLFASEGGCAALSLRFAVVWCLGNIIERIVRNSIGLLMGFIVIRSEGCKLDELGACSVYHIGYIFSMICVVDIGVFCVSTFVSFFV